jgi:hypothetical protein
MRRYDEGGTLNFALTFNGLLMEAQTALFVVCGVSRHPDWRTSQNAVGPRYTIQFFKGVSA